MDTPLVGRIFNRLFAHETCSVLRFHRLPPAYAISQRAYSTPVRKRPDPLKGKKVTLADLKDKEAWNKRSEFFQDDIADEYMRYPTVTADILRMRKTRPKRVKMLLRDFIEDSLYNPYYGYFSKEAIIFDAGEPFDFNCMKTGSDFIDELQARYDVVEDKLDAEEDIPTQKGDLVPELADTQGSTRLSVDQVFPKDLRQMWHTPTELFKPYYSEAIARYMATNYKLSQYPYHDLLIYEMGAGNGTFMLNVLDYLQDEFPEVYERTKFRIIEVSSSLADLQATNLQAAASRRGHLSKVEIINQSVFDWDTYVSDPCFFVALEVWDNFAHDGIRYNPQTLDALQTWVLVDREGEYYEYYESRLDPVAMRYLRIRDETVDAPYDHPLKKRDLRRRFIKMLPGAGVSSKYTMPEYIPTRLMQFFDILHNYFPAHRLVVSDFNGFKTEVRGVNAPAVQTRFKRKMVGVTTPLVYQGQFDIMFPTNFPVVENMYRAMTGKLTRLVTQEDFLKRWADTEATRTLNGENPLLDWYKNASVMLTL